MTLMVRQMQPTETGLPMQLYFFTDTVVWEEYSRFAERGDEPYYPINTEADKALYARYEELAKAEPRTVFGGRLGTYKYYDMHNVIDTALTAYEQQVEPLLKK